MNHLAHCFLSFGNEDWLLGNFIGDYVKGSDWERYPEPVQRGILLHRTIDSYTDSSPYVHRCSARLRPYSQRFSAPVNDILFDHLLAINWQKYATVPLDEFAQNTYAQLLRRQAEMPPVLQERLPRMVGGDFLQGYGHREGLEFVFGKFMGRVSIPFDHNAVLTFFMANLEEFNADFNLFFPNLVQIAKEFVQHK